MPDLLANLLEEYDAARAWTSALVADLDDRQLTWRESEQASAIGWHLGHQAAVNHFMVRNLTAAEPSFSADFDTLFDSATPEADRGSLPGRDQIHDYRDRIAASTRAVIGRIAAGRVGAPQQLAMVAQGLLRAVINHEYQHDAWVLEVRRTLTDRVAPPPASNRVVEVEGYWMLDL